MRDIMTRSKMVLTALAIALLLWGGRLSVAAEPLPIPDKLVVLEFDDALRTHFTNCAPLLKKYGFGGSFFVCEGWNFATNKETFMTWEQIRKLDEDGFEIGNHSGHHKICDTLSREALIAEVEHIERRCREQGITKPDSFAFPSGRHAPMCVEVLKEKGYLFAQRSHEPEFRQLKRGRAYDPKEDHHLLVPRVYNLGPGCPWKEFLWALDQAKDGKIAVLGFHGVPGWWKPGEVSLEYFERILKHLHDNGYQCVALRDLANYVDPTKGPDDPYEPIRRRVKAQQK